jgi:Fur family ferric uptake transcriptional regulator
MTSQDLAEQLVRRTGARVTRPRIQVLAALLQAQRAITHHEIERRLRRTRGIDRVTIYRVLEWLTRQGLAHRVALGERSWRFDAVLPQRAHRHAHFHCDHCGTVECLEGVKEPPKVKLPQGYRGDDIELTVKGACARCAPQHARQDSSGG